MENDKNQVVSLAVKVIVATIVVAFSIMVISVALKFAMWLLF